MKCLKHKNEATAVCSNCSVALCEQCSKLSPSKKHCCSNECEQAIFFSEKLSELTLERATKGALAGAYGSYLLGLVFLGFAVWGLFIGFIGAAIYMGLFGSGMVIMGYLYQKSTKSKLPIKK